MDAGFETISFGTFANDLDNAVSWLQNVGIRYAPTRLGEYKRAIETLLKIYTSDDVKKMRDEYARIVTALFEANDLILIHKDLAGKFDGKLRARIEKYAKGPVNYTEELTSSSSNIGRNTAFELLVMSKLVKAGIEPDFEVDGDIAVLFDNRSIIFECKRPQSLGKLESNIRDAFKQLEKRFLNPIRARHRGIIAIDISKIVNPDFMLYVQPNVGSLRSGLSRIIDNFIKENEKFWQTRRSSKTIAVLIRLGLMGVVEEKNRLLTYCQEYGLTPLNHVGERNIWTAKTLTYALANGGKS